MHVLGILVSIIIENKGTTLNTALLICISCQDVVHSVMPQHGMESFVGT